MTRKRDGRAVCAVYGLYALQSGGLRDRCYQYVFDARATVHECDLTLVRNLSAGVGRSDTPQLAEGHPQGRPGTFWGGRVLSFMRLHGNAMGLP